MGINDVSRALNRWKRTITGERTTGSYTDGRWDEDTPTVLSFTGVIQNATPDDLEVLEGGFRSSEAIKIHTTFRLIPLIEGTTEGDLIDYDSNVWLVYSVAHRDIGNYHKAIAVIQK